MTLPGAEPLAFQTTIFRFSSGKPQPLILFPDSTLGTDEGLVCNSTFAWNSSPNSVLGTVGGSCSSPLCLESILDASVLGVCWFNPFPKLQGNCWLHTGPSLARIQNHLLVTACMLI